MNAKCSIHMQIRQRVLSERSAKSDSIRRILFSEFSGYYSDDSNAYERVSLEP